MKKKPEIIIDTDAGADDLLAITLLFSANSYLIKKIITSYGSFSLKESTSRINKLLSLIGAEDIAVIETGAQKPLKRSFEPYHLIHGDLWISEEQKHTKLNIKKLVDNLLPKTDYFCLGPLTNLSKLLDEKDFLKKINNIYIMGGAISYPGNATPLAEANFFWDPDAVEKVFKLASEKIRLIPLNITEQIQLNNKDIKFFKEQKIISGFFKPYLHYYLKIKKWFLDPKDYLQKKYSGASIHDVVAVISLFDNRIINFKPILLATDLIKKEPGFIYPILRQEQQSNKKNSYKIMTAVNINQKEFWETFNKVLVSR
ncbi:MAG: hypothetical protein COU63_05050 [Candidatus Pacebacteria bacterium CG10_big_fil_rev_8_21_14_0_10_36_11]|nr:hypothetical protein [Candidatus Pacearchaeota archaeon]OIP73839.1 MAG: hypothetical protein AUK08_04760 [Candidatus Pacebacteria bacterium CG2_30_36_39]PIR64305.1 MAG: hypothetical protein COU63_05050 [Candidatus Pacebacteria bacterium CG10_big_fil_rev_8_21_14_0_10_36_11]PJC42429.1 MAG: hypothetical protein CO040_04500 [Candidatus Pacebacteria bacterium CG_4_9_14_0_2_um_filter_36_8]